MDKAFDPSWVEKARKGDHEAFGELYSYSCQAAYMVIVTMIREDKETAADLLQDTFIKVYQRLDQLENPEKFRAWVKQIARNTALDYIKKSKVLAFSELYVDEEMTVEVEDPDISHLPEIIMDKQETFRLLMEILETLPPAQRTVVSMHYFQGLSIKEVAASLGHSENTIKVQLFQARKSMGEKICDMEKKQDIKLYSVSPVAFIKLLAWGLEELTVQADPEILAAILPEFVTDTVSSVSATIEAARKAIARKIAAGILAATTVAGGVVGYTVLNKSPELPEKDLFDSDYAVTFSGENGEGIAHVHSLDGYGLDYAVVPGDDLSNGDIVTLTLSAPNGDTLEEYCAEHYGFIPSYDSRKYVVADLELQD